VDLKFSLLDADKPFRSFAVNNPDGWGIGNYENNSTKVFKEGISAIESNELPTLSKEVISKIIIAHVIKASDNSKAPSSVENSHSFKYDNWLFAHNGSIDEGHLLEILYGKYKKDIKGQTDSEIFFYWILQAFL
jgi:glutamine amidotransferase